MISPTAWTYVWSRLRFRGLGAGPVPGRAEESREGRSRPYGRTQESLLEPSPIERPQLLVEPRLRMFPTVAATWTRPGE